MSIFSGNQVPAAFQRLVRYFTERPEALNMYSPGDNTFDVVEKSMDLMDDGIENDSTPIYKPITGISASIDITNYDIGTGNIPGGQITASIVPADTTESAQIIYSSSDSGIATVDVSGAVTAIGVGSADITAQIQGTGYSQVFNVTVIDTV